MKEFQIDHMYSLQKSHFLVDHFSHDKFTVTKRSKLLSHYMYSLHNIYMYYRTLTGLKQKSFNLLADKTKINGSKNINYINFFLIMTKENTVIMVFIYLHCT